MKTDRDDIHCAISDLSDQCLEALERVATLESALSECVKRGRSMLTYVPRAEIVARNQAFFFRMERIASGEGGKSDESGR